MLLGYGLGTLSRELLGLIHERRLGNAVFEHARSHLDDDDIEEVYFLGALQLCLDANALYSRLARQTGLKPSALGPESQANMRAMIGQIADTRRNVRDDSSSILD